MGRAGLGPLSTISGPILERQAFKPCCYDRGQSVWLGWRALHAARVAGLLASASSSITPHVGVSCHHEGGRSSTPYIRFVSRQWGLFQLFFTITSVRREFSKIRITLRFKAAGAKLACLLRHILEHSSLDMVYLAQAHWTWSAEQCSQRDSICRCSCSHRLRCHPGSTDQMILATTPIWSSHQTLLYIHVKSQCDVSVIATCSAASFITI